MKSAMMALAALAATFSAATGQPAPTAGATTAHGELRVATTINAGAILQAADIVRTEGVSPEGRDSSLDLIGKAALRRLAAGSVVSPRDVRPPILVSRNAVVVMEFVRGPLNIIAEGRALSAGGQGEAVKVLNSTSRTAVTALVVGPNRVRVSP